MISCPGIGARHLRVPRLPDRGRPSIMRLRGPHDAETSVVPTPGAYCVDGVELILSRLRPVDY